MGRRLPLWLEPPVRASRLGLLHLAVALGGATRRRRCSPVLRAAWQPGLSVLIPERGTPALLERALDHLQPALSQVPEPTEILVVVNGAPAEAYAGLQARFTQVRWQFHVAPLGFSGALARGLAAVRHGSVYLHNSDMAIEADALALLLPWRAPQVFAIASQIFFDDPGKRREETGWGDLCLDEDGHARLFDRSPEPDGKVRGGLYAGGGSSLFDATLLRRFAANTRGYAPFYWEDADWGLQAWRHGLEVLFHPGSVALHRHRATISQHHAAAEIDRIVARNALLFELRNFCDPGPALRRAVNSDWPTVKDLARPVALTEIRRLRAAQPPCAAVDMEQTSRRVYVRPVAADTRPLVLVISPYCILPPRHGGAWRTWRLCEALQERWRFMLLSDEASGHSAASWQHSGAFDSVHLVAGRPDGPSDRSGRIRSHSHAALQAELDRLVAVHAPALIQLEHVELCGLRPPSGRPSLLVAHDVLLTANGQDDADHFERQRLAAFDALVVCSAEDAALLQPLPAAVVPNGAVVGAPCRPSAGHTSLLFAGPFRYAPNLHGLRLFMDQVFPELRRRFPALRLDVLAGAGGRVLAAAEPWAGHAGVVVQDAVDDVRPWLEACALSINPLLQTRGSSLKLIESLAAGRVCVCTRDGARGFLNAGLSGLLVVEDIAAMLEPVSRMLADEPARLRLERPDAEALRSHGWDRAAQAQDRVYQALLAQTRRKR